MSRKNRNADEMFDRRMFIAAGVGGVVWATLAARFFQLQFLDAERYQGLAEANHVKLVMAPPERGQILDRFGRPLGHKTQRVQSFLRIFAPHRIHHQPHLLWRDL